MAIQEGLDAYGAELAHRVWLLSEVPKPEIIKNLSRSAIAFDAGVALQGYETGENTIRLVKQRNNAAALAAELYGYMADHPEISAEDLEVIGDLAQRLSESSKPLERSVVHEVEPLHGIVFGMSDEALALASMRFVR